MIINYNSMASNALRQLNINQSNQAKSMAKLSSGLRINSAADDAAGLTISEEMKGQINGLDQASRNAQDGISMTQTAEGALSATTDILQRMRELAVQGSNDTNTSTDRANIQSEMDQLTSQINGIGNTTEFNNQKLLDGSKDGTTAGTGIQLQIGANESQSMTLNFSDMRSVALGLSSTVVGGSFTATLGVTNGTSNTVAESGLDVSTAANSSNAITVIDKAINTVSTERAKMGAYENRLNYTTNNLATSSQNISDAQSRIADVDMASEMMKQSQASVLSQAAQSMLYQANQQPQQVLQLLR